MKTNLEGIKMKNCECEDKPEGYECGCPEEETRAVKDKEEYLAILKSEGINYIGDFGR